MLYLFKETHEKLEILLRRDTDSAHNSWKIFSPTTLLLQQPFILEGARALHLEGALTCREVSLASAGGVSKPTTNWSLMP